MRPNLFIVGAPRCGTTAMFEFLGQHPDIFPCQVKEPYFFTEEVTPDRIEGYLRLFRRANAERWLLEATPYYLVDPVAISRIRDFAPDARLIVMLRNPIEAMYSLHQRLLLNRREEIEDVRKALSRLPRYRETGRYGAQLRRAYSAFSREQVHVILYDDFIADIPAVYRQALVFLEIDSGFAPRFRIVNANAAPRSTVIQNALWNRGSLVGATSRAIVPAQLRRKLRHGLNRANRRPSPRPPLDPALRLELWEELKDDVALLGEILGRDLISLWRPM